ncbi:MAG: TolB family protein, partial [Planctomycetota bacterium]
MPKRPIQPSDLWSIPAVGAPCPSPDGSMLVVPVTEHDLEENKSATRLWLVRPGKRPRALTAEGSKASQPAWSPDGSRLLFVRQDDKKKSQVFLLRLDGGEAEQVSDVEDGATDPKWFPDGKRIAYLANTRVEKKVETKAKYFASDERMARFWDRWLTDGLRWHIFVRDLERGTSFDLTPRLKGRFPPMEPAGNYDIAPDGKEIAFCCVASRPKDPVRWGVFRVRVSKKGASRGASASGPTPIEVATDGNVFGPRYSPDGKTILLGHTNDILSWANRARLLKVNRRTGKATEIAPGWTLDPGPWTFGPRGEVIALAEVEGRTGIFRMGRRPKELRRGGTFGGLRIAGKRLYVNVSTVSQPGEI